jgi:hypothetical protein
MRIGAVCLLFTLGACGGVGTPGPTTLGADEDTGCPSADDALSHTKAELDGPDLDALRPHLHQILVDDGGLRVLLQSVTTILAGVDPSTVTNLLHGFDPSQGLAKLTPHVIDILQYVDGSSPYVAGAHEDPIVALHAILDRCDAADTTTTLAKLLSLEVKLDPVNGPTLAAPGTGDESWLTAVLDASRAAFEDPNVKAVLEKIKLDDGKGTPGSIHIGKDAFELVAKLLAANLAAPNFDPNYTQNLLDQVLVSQITDAASRAKIDGLLSLVLLVTDPSADVFPQVQSLMQCVNANDTQAAIPGMVYDWLTIPTLSVDQFLDDLSASTGTASGATLRAAAIQVMDALVANPDIARDSIGVLAKFLDADTAPVVVHTTLAIRGKGVVGELLHLLDALKQCRPGSSL